LLPFFDLDFKGKYGLPVKPSVDVTELKESDYDYELSTAGDITICKNILLKADGAAKREDALR